VGFHGVRLALVAQLSAQRPDFRRSRFDVPSSNGFENGLWPSAISGSALGIADFNFRNHFPKLIARRHARNACLGNQPLG
jgi:hypothetical protein